MTLTATPLAISTPVALGTCRCVCPDCKAGRHCGQRVYGCGYVLLAFLRSGLVERGGWITEAQSGPGELGLAHPPRGSGTPAAIVLL